MKHIQKFNSFINEDVYFNVNKQKQMSILASLGYNIIKAIGGGSYGNCFLEDNGNIVKITNDRSNAIASQSLIGKNLEYLSNVYRVIKVVDNNIALYVIEMESCDTKNLDKNKLKNIFNLFSYKKMNVIYKIYPNSYVRDFLKIQEEARENEIRLDLQNSGNFGLKNGHLCAFDLGINYLHSNKAKMIEQEIEVYIEKN